LPHRYAVSAAFHRCLTTDAEQSDLSRYFFQPLATFCSTRQTVVNPSIWRMV